MSGPSYRTPYRKLHSFQDRVADLMAQGHGAAAIVSITKRYMSGVEHAMEAVERKQKRQTSRKQRKCLTCGKQFTSAWVGNRVCHPCTGIVSRRQGAFDDNSNIGWHVKPKGVRG